MPSIILPTNSVRRPASRLVVVGSSRKKVERALSRGGRWPARRWWQRARPVSAYRAPEEQETSTAIAPSPF